MTVRNAMAFSIVTKLRNGHCRQFQNIFMTPGTPHPPAAATPCSPLPYLPTPSPLSGLAGLHQYNGCPSDADAAVWGPQGGHPASVPAGEVYLLFLALPHW